MRTLPLRAALVLPVLALAAPALVAVGATAQPAPAPAAAATTSSAPQAAPRGGAPVCAEPLLPAPARAAQAERALGAGFAEAARANGRTVAELRREARDPALWLDRCGLMFFVEEPASPRQLRERSVGSVGTGASQPVTASAATAGGTDTVPLAETFLLQSNPGARLTVYLDFLGGTVTGTAWNQSYGATISVAPFSITSPADTAFTSAELAEIQRTWQVVAEDYAPFDVNVTTKDPGAAAIERSSSTDLAYGTRVRITGGGPVYDGCGCGGVAYVGTFALSGSQHAYYQPAWVFSNGTGTSGKAVGEAASHEAGHNLGLSHDGQGTSAYYSGAAPWAPIMGAGYYQPVVQWSQGEYSSATQTQDDLAVIAGRIPLRADDHGGDPGTASALGATPVDGIVSTRTDTDAFGFTAAGATTVTVTPAAGAPNLDVRLRVLDASGAEVAVVDPPVARVSTTTASGLGATWTAQLPPEGGRWTVVVDGTGSGDPLTAGRYSDYGSLGWFRVALSTEQPTTPTSLTTSVVAPPPAVVGRPWTATPVTASGGRAPYSFAATGLPAGLVVDAATGTFSGTPTTAGESVVVVTVTDAAGATGAAEVPVTVTDAPASPVTVADQALPAGTVGTAYAGTLTAVGGDGTYTWTATGVPAGLTVQPDGRVTGAPTTAGSATLRVTATSAGSSATGSATIVVAPAPVRITTTTLPAGKVKRAYSATISTTGGSAPLTWQRSGTLPPGTSLLAAADGRSVTVSGTPTSKGTFAFGVVVTDASGATSSASYRVTIR